MGWKPGRGLGSSVEGRKDHVKVKVKTDARGLGKPTEQDKPTGLDVFQRILGKLNGTSEEVEKEIHQRQRMSGLYLHFVPGGVLEGTVKTKEQAKKEQKARKSVEKQKRKAEKAANRAEKALMKQAKRESRKKRTHTEHADSSTKDVNGSISGMRSDAVSDQSPAIESPGSESPATESPSQGHVAPAARGIRATRNRYIAMKRKATADAQSLKEILMQ